MYALQSQVETYKNAQKAGMSGRETEASVLMKAAMMLKICQENWDSADRDARLDEALRFNQLIWSVFQSELVKEDNPLPKKLREDILSLGLFIDKRIFDVMAYPASEKLDVIVNISLNLAAGLRAKPKE